MAVSTDLSTELEESLLETMVGSEYWEFPTYSEILFSVK